MLPVKDIQDVPAAEAPVILAMGCFDGVHIGHQKVISTAVEQASERGGQAWIYTFNPHPAKVLRPDKAPPLISAEPCRMRQFAALGADGVIEIPFDRTYAQTEPEEFLDNLKNGIPSLSGIVCGADWSFGYKARGTFQTLKTFCDRHGMTATAVHPILFEGEKISSTQIRKTVAEGNIPLAEQLLGRPFSIFGKVVTGRGIGRQLGFPTANIDPQNELIPAPGIYAAWTRLSGSQQPVPSAVFIGERKTFNDNLPVVESYLIDFNGDLYGQDLEIVLKEKVRDVHPFPDRQALIEQIGNDVDAIRAMLSDRTCDPAL